MKSNFLFISCEEAYHICDKAQYGEANFWERFKLTLRLCWCRITRAYTKKNKSLTKAIHDSQVEALTEIEREELTRSIAPLIQKQSY